MFERGGVANPRLPGQRILLVVVALLFAVKLGVVLFGVDRGFDLGDEGVFLFCLNDPLQCPPLFEFYKLLAHIEPPLRFDPIGIRLLRVATELIATIALARAVFVWARSRFAAVSDLGFAPFLFLSLLGSLLTVGARGFGYNDATNFVVFLACACLFRSIASAPGTGAFPRRVLWAAAAGFAIGLQLFVKFPSSFLLLAIAAVGVAWLPRVGIRERLATAAAIAGGAATAIALFVLSNGGVAPLVEKWREAAELNRVAGYGIGEILAVYYHNDYGSHVNSLRLWGCFALVFFVARWLLRGRPGALDRALAIALVAGAVVLAWGSFTFHAVNVHPSLVFLFCLLGLLAPVSWSVAFWAWRRDPDARVERRRSEAFVPLLLLLALPFVAIVGTNVALTLKLPAHAAPIFLMLAIVLTQLAAAGFRRFAWTALGLLAVVTSAVFVEHQVVKPYGLASPLYEQDRETPLLPGLRVDAATSSFLDDLHARMTAAGFEPGDPVIALDFMPGLVYALGGRSPGFPFYAFDKPTQNCWAIERTIGDEVPFLILGQDMLIEQRECIRAFSFPDDFRFVGAVRNPYEAPIRYFFGGPAMPYVRVFAPARDASN